MSPCPGDFVIQRVYGTLRERWAGQDIRLPKDVCRELRTPDDSQVLASICYTTVTWVEVDEYRRWTIAQGKSTDGQYTELLIVPCTRTEILDVRDEFIRRVRTESRRNFACLVADDSKGTLSSYISQVAREILGKEVVVPDEALIPLAVEELSRLMENPPPPELFIQRRLA